MFHNLGPLEGVCSIILAQWWGRAFHNLGPWRECVPLSWSTRRRVFHDHDPLDRGCSIILFHWREGIP